MGLKPAKKKRGKNASSEARRMDPLMLAFKALHSAATPDSMDAPGLERQRLGQEIIGRLAAPKTGLAVTRFDMEGIAAEWTRLKLPHGDKRAILYCHGGGYTSGNLGYSQVLAAKLAFATGYDVLSFEYRLAPEHPYPAAVEDAEAAWDRLMLGGLTAGDVVIAGDSAGGNLALVLALRLRDAGKALPRALVLMSPWTDMTMGGDSYRERAEIDPVLTVEYIEAVRSAYARGRDLRTPYLSPLFAELEGLPPTLVQVGENEILYSDSEALGAKLLRAGVTCRFEVSPEMWHVFQMFPTRRSSEAVANVTRFLLEL